MSKYVEGTDMRCLMCGSHLIECEVGPFETLEEQVSDPNGDIPDKQSYGCPNDGCEIVGWRYLHNGEGPYTDSLTPEHLRDLVHGSPAGTLWDAIKNR